MASTPIPRIPPVIYVFALCAFALGFTELITIGLVSTMSTDLQISIDRMGLAVTTYALGAVIGAPLLTALAASWPRKRLMIAAMAVFTLGNVIMCLSQSLPPLLIGRFLSGLGHGVFLAVASSVAAHLVPRERAGSAVAVVFSGLTVALALGVPIGTFLATQFHWHTILVAVSISGALGLLGLVVLMPTEKAAPSQAISAYDGLRAICNSNLVTGASITVLSFAGAFAFYTFIGPVLLEVTHVSERTMSALMLVFGICAYVGNVWGGRLSDRKGADYAVRTVLIGLSLVLIAVWMCASSFPLMIILTGLLGALTYAGVPALQARLIALSHLHAPRVPAVAAGMNIAGFNGGIALGSFTGGVGLGAAGLTSTALIGGGFTLLGLVALYLQNKSKGEVSVVTTS